MLALLLLLASAPVTRIYGWPEVRLYQTFAGSESSLETTFPHGVGYGDRGHEFGARVGLRVAGDGEAEAALGLIQWLLAPIQTRVRPVLGVEMGGYALLRRRSAAERAAAVSGPRWLWSLQSSVGLQADLMWGLGLRLAASAAWIQEPTSDSVGLASGWGLGGGLTWSFDLAAVRGLAPDLLTP